MLKFINCKSSRLTFACVNLGSFAACILCQFLPIETGIFKFVKCMNNRQISIKNAKMNDGKLTFLVPINPKGKIDGDTLVFELNLKDKILSGTMREKKHPKDKAIKVTWKKPKK